MTWLDEKDAAKVEIALGGMRDAAAAGNHAAETCIHHAGGDERYALWLFYADRRCGRLAGVGIFDLVDFGWHDAFTAGDSPRDAAREALESDDLFAPLMAGLGDAR